ncbi:748_t:CDS:2, partial [Entrophospora sp. SA101]
DSEAADIQNVENIPPSHEGVKETKFDPKKILTNKEFSELEKFVNPILVGKEWLNISEQPNGLLEAFSMLTIAEKSQSFNLVSMDCEDSDIQYILDLLRYIVEMIDKGIPNRQNSEHDLDIFFNFHALGTDLKWGREFSAAANVGAKTDNPKMGGNGVWLQVLLCDIHMSLSRNILNVRKNQHNAALQLLNKILCL